MTDTDHNSEGPKASRLNRSNLRDIMLLCSIVSSLMFPQTIPEVVFGFGLLAIGGALHVVTKGQLIRNVVLCRTGVYGMVRHPYYLANYSIDLAICLLSGNIYLVVAYPFLFFWAYGPTVRNEETYLAFRHGDLFREHAAATPQIFPHGDSIPRWRELFEGFSVKRVSLKEWARVARFFACGFFITLIHEAKTKGLNGLISGYDSDALLLSGLVVFLSVLSLFLLARRNRPNRVKRLAQDCAIHRT